MNENWECEVCGTLLHLIVTQDHYLKVLNSKDKQSFCTDGEPHHPKMRRNGYHVQRAEEDLRQAQ